MENQTYINEGLEVLKKGGVILYPTDTLWGLGCDATNAAAVSRIYSIKSRQDSKALVLLASSMDMIASYVEQIPSMASELVSLSTTPLTVIYPKAIVGQGFLAQNAVASDGSVAIRVPQMEFCLDLVRRLGRPVVSTSANISENPSPKCFAQIDEKILREVDYIFPCEMEKSSLGKPSRIIKLGLDNSFNLIR